MSIYYGDEAIAYLAKKSQQQDPKSSSHWNNYHSDFSYKNGEFSGLIGFGSIEKKHNIIKEMMHFYFQYPYRKIGRNFSDFSAIYETAKEICIKCNKGFDLNMLRQVITLAYLNEMKVADNGLSCVIGDGFGKMTGLLYKHFHQRVVLVNLAKTLLVDICNLKLILEDKFNADLCIVNNKKDMLAALSDSGSRPSIIALEAENHKLIQLCQLDLTINTQSMQEMNPEVVREYFKDISIASKDRHGVFYCSNREEKILPDGTIVSFNDFPWTLATEILEDELNPWTQRFYSFKPPFYRNYLGPIRHRLVKFS